MTFTRSRSSRKNDNYYVEQKNRRLVCYLRHGTEGEQKILEQLYHRSRVYYNLFQPNMKAQSKERIGSRVVKRYDRPRTPYQRLLDSLAMAPEQKKQLRRTYQELNLVKLKVEINKLKDKLWRLQETLIF